MSTPYSMLLKTYVGHSSFNNDAKYVVQLVGMPDGTFYIDKHEVFYTSDANLVCDEPERSLLFPDFSMAYKHLDAMVGCSNEFATCSLDPCEVVLAYDAYTATIDDALRKEHDEQEVINKKNKDRESRMEDRSDEWLDRYDESMQSEREEWT